MKSRQPDMIYCFFVTGKLPVTNYARVTDIYIVFDTFDITCNMVTQRYRIADNYGNASSLHLYQLGLCMKPKSIRE